MNPIKLTTIPNLPMYPRLNEFNHSHLLVFVSICESTQHYNYEKIKNNRYPRSSTIL